MSCCMPAMESINIEKYFVICLTVPYPTFRARRYIGQGGVTLERKNWREVWRKSAHPPWFAGLLFQAPMGAVTAGTLPSTDPWHTPPKQEGIKKVAFQLSENNA